jgi:hypothetical protein
MTQMVKVSRGTVVGIGKLKIPRTPEFNYEIPMLSFLVINENQDNYVASCMHLRVDGYGKKEDLAVNDMIENISFFLKANFSKVSIEDAWFNLKDVSRIDDTTKELWDAYRDVQFDLASIGITTDSVAILKKRIEQLQFRIKQLEKENALLKEDIIVDYTPLRTAA